MIRIKHTSNILKACISLVDNGDKHDLFLKFPNAYKIQGYIHLIYKIFKTIFLKYRNRAIFAIFADTPYFYLFIGYRFDQIMGERIATFQICIHNICKGHLGSYVCVCVRVRVCVCVCVCVGGGGAGCLK